MKLKRAGAQFFAHPSRPGRIRATFPQAEVHALSDGAEPGTFEAIVSTFNTVVTGLFYDQMLKPGCFARTLQERGYPAVIWSHDWDTPPIGVTLDAGEVTEGLSATGRLFIADGEDSPLARQVYTAMTAKGGDGRPPLREFSIGFDIVEAEWEVHDSEEILAISDVELYEYGPCLVGRNVSRLVEVASAEGSQAHSSDPVLARFPRPRQPEPREYRELCLARPRHVVNP